MNGFSSSLSSAPLGDDDGNEDENENEELYV